MKVSEIRISKDGFQYRAVWKKVRIPQPKKDYPPGTPPVYAEAWELSIQLVR